MICGLPHADRVGVSVVNKQCMGGWRSRRGHYTARDCETVCVSLHQTAAYTTPNTLTFSQHLLYARLQLNERKHLKRAV